MGRRKIEIKAIKDDRNRSVTFLKRKGGLFKKAHELSVLCSVDVAVFVFGNNKKLYEYSSADMRDLIARYQFHPGPSEHKGPADFNGGNDDDEDEDGEGTPPNAPEDVGPTQMMPPQYHGQQQPPFPQIRHHTPSASPPIPNGAFHPHQRGHTPQPSVGSRPGSRNDMRRMPPNMVSQQSHPSIAYMPTPPIYNSARGQPGMMQQPNGQYPYTQQPLPPPPPPPQPQQAPPAYMEDRRPSAPPTYNAQPPPRRSPPQPSHIHQPIPQISAPPQPEIREPQPPPPVQPKMEPMDRPQVPLLNTDSAIKKMPQRKTHSIFTPIEENRSILSQHLASFVSEPQSIKQEAHLNRPHSVDVAYAARVSPPMRPISQNSLDKGRTSTSSISETIFSPPSRSNSFKSGPAPIGVRPRGPRLTVQIPDEGTETETAVIDSNSPRNPEQTPQPQRQSSHSSIVLPPPSPSASALLSAGATGPPNPFARPPPQQGVNGEQTPASALPSRFLGAEFLNSPNSFYSDWNFRAGDNNTLPSPLNFSTPLAGSGPSFLRDEHHTSTAATTAPSTTASTATSGAAKRKSSDYGVDESNEETKRVRVE